MEFSLVGHVCLHWLVLERVCVNNMNMVEEGEGGQHLAF